MAPTSLNLTLLAQHMLATRPDYPPDAPKVSKDQIHRTPIILAFGTQQCWKQFATISQALLNILATTPHRLGQLNIGMTELLTAHLRYNCDDQQVEVHREIN